MLRFALDEVNRPAPNDPASVFHSLGLTPPLWAILNDTPTPDEHAQYQNLLAAALRRPDAGDPETNLAAENAFAVPAAVPQGTPPSVTRSGGEPSSGVYVTDHPIFPGGPLHSALAHITESGANQWLSAGPNAGYLRSGLGDSSAYEAEIRKTPVGKYMRPNDEPRYNRIMARLTPPQGMSDADYWDMLKSLDERYQDNVRYMPIPGLFGKNSNSYVTGLIEASGGTPPPALRHLIGGASPLPARNFASPHLQATGFPDSLQPQQPPFFRRIPEPQ